MGAIDSPPRPEGSGVVPLAFASAEVIDAKGDTHTLRTYWAKGPAVIVVLRHFACVACAEHVALLAPRLEELVRLGLTVVYLGNGGANYLDGFIERNGIDAERVHVVTDPSLRAHAALGLVRSAASTYGPRALVALGRAVLRGFRQFHVEGDNLQQGGVLVIGRDARIEYVHRDRHTGDHAPMGDVVEAALRVAAADLPV